MIHVKDERLVRLIILGKKTTHRFPASYRPNGDITNPKIVVGKKHKVYTRAPFGRDGDRSSEPLLEVIITDVHSDNLGDTNNDEAITEGFRSIEAFRIWWDKTWGYRNILFEKNLIYPVWVISFKFSKILPAGEKLMKRLEKKLG
jgi:hypothetical protein